MKRIAINGFGRIGRLALRNILLRDDLEIVAINDLTEPATLAHLFKYDSAHGIWGPEVSHTDGSIIIDGRYIRVCKFRDPSDLPWKELEVDVVLECTGIFTDRNSLQKHIDAGAKRVVLSAPASGNEIPTFVLGVNDQDLGSDARIISNASCTTNCLAPIVKLLDTHFGIRHGFITTTHAYTADQRLQDAPHKDLRRARAAAANIVPTSTGAARAVSLVYPQIAGKLDALAFRVPVITGSLIDANLVINNTVTVSQVNEVVKDAAAGHLRGIVQYCMDPIVSSDIIGNKHSAIFDAALTQVKGDLLKTVAWYDNEAGYAARLVDMAVRVAYL